MTDLTIALLTADLRLTDTKDPNEYFLNPPLVPKVPVVILDATEAVSQFLSLLVVDS